MTLGFRRLLGVCLKISGVVIKVVTPTTKATMPSESAHVKNLATDGVKYCDVSFVSRQTRETQLAGYTRNYKDNAKLSLKSFKETLFVQRSTTVEACTLDKGVRSMGPSNARIIH